MELAKPGSMAFSVVSQGCSQSIIPPENCCLYTPFVGRGHDPADQVAHFALVRFNESTFVSLRFGGVMTPPYEWCVTQTTIYTISTNRFM